MNIPRHIVESRTRCAAQESPLFDASMVARGLYVGGFPPTGKALRHAGFTTLILCASLAEYDRTYGPAVLDAKFDGVFVIRAPLDDQNPTPERPNLGRPTGGELRTAHDAASRAASVIAGGGRVLVTCAMGRNRSGFVAALTIHRLSGARGDVCADRVRRARGPAVGGPEWVLSNPWFRAHLAEVR